MSYALVGSHGAVATAVVGATCSPAWGASESRTAGNLLLLWSSVLAVSTFTATPSGWSVAKQIAGTSVSQSLYYKIAAGGDAAPVLAGVTSGRQRAMLAEFSGNAASSPLDQVGSAVTTTTSMTATAGAVDAAAAELVIYGSVAVTTSGVARTLTDTLNNGATATNLATVNGTLVTDHYSFGYGITTGDSAADHDAWTISSATGLTGAALAIASFKLAAGVATTAKMEPSGIIRAW